MRLIDADIFAELSKNSVPVLEEDIDDYSWTIGYTDCLKGIDNTPTVEAIPIEWMKKHALTILLDDIDWWEKAVDTMWEDWRKENG